MYKFLKGVYVLGHVISMFGRIREREGKGTGVEEREGGRKEGRKEGRKDRPEFATYTDKLAVHINSGNSNGH